MNTCVVLMSTYNGEKYLEEQINSILSQTDVDFRLIVRDDNSSDGTIAILRRYENHPRFQWYAEENLGCAKSFMDLLMVRQTRIFMRFRIKMIYGIRNKINRATYWLRQRDA